MEKITDIVARLGSISSFEEMMLPSTIRAASNYVWLRAINSIDRAKSDNFSMDGRPGFHWSGSQSSLINDLFPAIEGGYQYTPDQAQAFRQAINSYLRNSGIMVVRRRGGARLKSLWWVSEHWTELKVTTVPKNDPEPEPVEDEEHEGETTDPVLQCRVCEMTFTLPHVRAAHERRTHLKWFKNDGTMVDLPPGPISRPELHEMIQLIAMEAKGPETLRYFFRQARDLDPRAIEAQVHRAVIDLADDPESPITRNVDVDQYVRFSYVEPEKSEKPEIVGSGPAVAECSEDPSTGIDRHIANLEETIELLRALGRVQEDVKYLQEELDRVTGERDTALENLAAMTEERDSQKRILDMLRSELLGEKKQN